MSTTICSIRNFLILIGLVLCSQYAFSSEVDEPENTVKHFYYQYLKEDSKSNVELIKNNVSLGLVEGIKNSFECNYDSDTSMSVHELKKNCSQKRECRNFNDHYSCNWDGFWIEPDVDYFTKSQDIYPSWKKEIATAVISQVNDEAEVKVSLGDGSDPVMTLNVTMKLDNKAWKIISVTE